MDINQLQYAPRVTRVSLGKCSSVDFVVLLLARAGEQGMAVKDIYAAYCAWRGGVLGRNGQDSRITYFFAREYGHISVSWLDTRHSLGNPGYLFGNHRTTLWYRVSRGVYALNVNGRARAEVIATTLPCNRSSS